MASLILFVCLGVLGLGLGTTAVPLAHVQIDEQAKGGKDGLILLREILSSLQSVEESTIDESDELSEMVVQKLSEEQSRDATHKEVSEQLLSDKQNSELNQDAHRRAFLQRALRIGLMQLLSREADRESNRKAQQQLWRWPHPYHRQWSEFPQTERAHQQRGKRSTSPSVTQRSALKARVSQDFSDYYDNWWNDIDLRGYNNIPDYYYDGWFPSPDLWPHDINYDYGNGYGDHNPHCVCGGKAAGSEGNAQRGDGRRGFARRQRG